MIQLKLAKSGEFTVQVYKENKRFLLHSQYDPIREAENLVEIWDVPKEGVLIIYGLGCGHHIRSLLRKVDFAGKIIILECCEELVDTVQSAGIINDIIYDSRVKLIVSSNQVMFSKILSEYLQQVQKGTANFVIHRPSLKIIPEEMRELKILLEEYQVQSTTLAVQREHLYANLQKVWPFLYKYPNIGDGFNCFKDVPAIIVSAGPTLDRALPFLKRLENKALILCVGTAFKAVRRFGIYPHFVVAIEPQKAVLEQFKEIEHNTPLIALPTTCPDLTLSYKGPVIWAFPEGIEELNQEALKHQLPTIQSGGSVATIALSIAGSLGCRPITFVGQDLAYVNGRTHASGTMYDGKTANLNRSLTAFTRYTQAVGGGTIPTSLSWDLFRKWIEQYILEHPSHQYYNASFGARIKGTIERSLPELIADGLFDNEYDINGRISTIYRIAEWSCKDGERII
jgi:hypothetical protein